MSTKGEIRTGIAGWIYPEWRGSFYPEGLPQKSELNYAGSKLGAIEINATFYSTQKPESFANWSAQVPEDFIFSLKGPRYISQALKLKDVAEPLANFMASGVLRLGQKLGPIIWQLPVPFKYDEDRLERFLSLLPQTPEQASALAKRHTDRLKNPPFTTTEGITRLRHAVETRDESFAHPQFVQLLRKYNVALVCPDTEQWPYRDLTADFTYARLQGPADGRGAYKKAHLDAWAMQARYWAEGKTSDGPLIAEAPAEARPRDVFVFFVNENKIDAPHNAMALMNRIAQCETA